ncbi:hypothetical protein ABDF71_21760 [Ochrobactrum sp. WV_118_8]
MSIKLSMPQATILGSLAHGPMNGVKRTPPVMVLVSKGLAEFTSPSTLTITEAGKRFIKVAL